MTCRLSATDLSPARCLGLWQRVQIPAELGQGYADRLRLGDGLAIAYSHYRPRRDLLESSVVEQEEPSLVITLPLSGASCYRPQVGEAFDFAAGQTTVTAFRYARGERCYHAGKDVRQLRLIVEHSALRKYALEGLLRGLSTETSASLLSQHDTDNASLQLAKRLVSLHDNDAGLLDVQIATLTLLSEQARRFGASTQDVCARHAHDEARLWQARDILLQQFAQPLTVSYLCAAVGLNEFRFKQTFRELFGTSPHRLLSEIRMRKAWELLEAGEQAASVGYKVGYQHPSSFNAAFQRHFGRTPGSVTRALKSV